MSGERNVKGAIYSFAGGAFLAGFGFYEYSDLAAMEASGGTRKVNTLVHMMYSLGGKLAVLGLFLLIAVFLVFTGVQRLRGKAG